MRFFEKKLFLFTLIAVAASAAIPFVLTARVYGRMLDIFPIFVDIDHNYYYARIRDILDGNLWLGNPFYIEHINQKALAFSSSEWLTALPMLLGVPFVAGLLFNTVAWAALFYGLVYKLLREFDVTERSSIVSSLVIYIASYPLVIRPIAMQVVFPFFLLFCIAFVRWLKSPSPHTSVLVVVAAAANFYIYAYSWQIVAVTLIVVTGLFLVQRKKELALNAFMIGCGTLLLGLPVLIYTVQQTVHPLYWESVMRTAMATTRIPTFGVVVYGAPLIAATLFVLLAAKHTRKDLRVLRYFIYCLVPALFVAATSNIITAKDPELASHVGRYMVLMGYVFLAAVLPSVGYFGAKKTTQLTLVGLLGLSAVYLAKDIAANIKGIDYGVHESAAVQAYHAPLRWLEEHESEPRVVFANQDISGYIPVMTKHYVVFSPFGGNHILTNAEQIERYLVGQFDISKIDEAQLSREMRAYTGTGPAIHQYKAVNRRVSLCRVLQGERLGFTCGKHITALTLLGDNYFVNILGTAAELNKDLRATYDKYQVAYILLDKHHDPAFAGVSLFPSKIYDDGRFEIWGRAAQK